jgi:hypothetical protein
MKTNRDGRECPPWCIRDHQNENEPWGCIGTEKSIPGHQGGADARLGTYKKTPHVAAWLFNGPVCDLAAAYADAPDQAEDLARFIEFAAEARKADLRGLAGKVREAAAEAWPQKEPEPEIEAGA